MEITQQADYAVRAIFDLALLPDEARASCEEIARRQGIPVAFLTKICARLAAEGLVQSQRGVNGGVWLARPAQEITLLEVVEAIDGPITFNRCNRQPSECERSRTCPVHSVWAELCRDFRTRLASHNFALMADSATHTPIPLVQL
jgi:Rrf2 family protein